MARLALGAILSIMFIILNMAGIAIFWRTFEGVIHMAFFAGNLRMFAFEFESREVVIKGCIFPNSRIVAVLALCAILSIMLIILRMAGITILRH